VGKKKFRQFQKNGLEGVRPAANAQNRKDGEVPTEQKEGRQKGLVDEGWRKVHHWVVSGYWGGGKGLDRKAPSSGSPQGRLSGGLSRNELQASSLRLGGGRRRGSKKPGEKRFKGGPLVGNHFKAV